jgi:ribosomal protein S18 acetylase RimI-like enzyme
LSYQIRKIEPDDIESASRMLLEAFKWFHKGDEESWLFRSFQPSSISAFSKIQDILVATKEDGQVVGYISSTNSLYGVAYIPTVAVDPSRQREGLGKKLLECKLDFLKEQGIRKVWLLVTSTNIPAIAFYLKNGFIIEGYLKDHTGPGSDEILFSKFLKV